MQIQIPVSSKEHPLFFKTITSLYSLFFRNNCVDRGDAIGTLENFMTEIFIYSKSETGSSLIANEDELLPFFGFCLMQLQLRGFEFSLDEIRMIFKKVYKETYKIEWSKKNNEND